jgi:non-lysosomal glucosylceramidase
MPDPLIPYSRDELYALAPQPVYQGEALRQIAFPIGGIGTGSVSLSGRGALVDWEIFNRPNKGSVLPFTFFSLWTRAGSEAPRACVLQAPPSPPFDGSGYGNSRGLGFGVARDTGAGLPHVRECTFRGEYPFAWIDFADPDLPLEVSLEAYNPFIPLNADDSGLPAAIFRFTLRNPRSTPVEATLAANLYNAVGYAGGPFEPRYLGAEGLGQNVNSFVREQGLGGLMMTSSRHSPTDPRFGSLALTTPWPDLTWQTAWLRAYGFDPLQAFWDEFSSNGVLTDRTYGPSDEGRSDIGTLGLRVRLEPGEAQTLPIYLTWHMPNFAKYWQRRAGPDGTPEPPPAWQNYYAQQFRNAFDVASYVDQNEERLRKESMSFHDALFTSTLPPYVIDAVASQASILKTTTCLRLSDGTFYAFEGCGSSAGCCEGSCTHVWNYAQTLAFLFPDLERSMREADYAYNLRKCGDLCFRIQLPLGSPPNDMLPAADGQMGGIMKVYRDWKLSGDTDWLRRLWPRVKQALAFAWTQWDVDRDGVMEGVQHNTYDIEFWGPNTMMGSFYLGALRAAEEMAHALGEEEEARTYHRIFERGRDKIEAELFNGEYYEQQTNRAADQVAPVDLGKCRGLDVPGELKYQYGAGCLSDQMIGQWFAHVVGLGYLFEPERVKQTLRSIFRYNWRADFWRHPNCQRIYALNDEKGLLLCSWPRGGRPAFPFVYSDEVWTGIEYQVASHLIYEGLVDEGLAIVRGLRERHDGVRRNPWNEFECGSHYARALASWSVLTALSGFSFDLTRGALGFAPRLDGPEFRVFWSMDSGWGSYYQRVEEGKAQAQLRLEYGSLALQELSLGLEPWATQEDHPPTLSARLNGRAIGATVRSAGCGLCVAFPDLPSLTAGDELSLDLAKAR